MNPDAINFNRPGIKADVCGSDGLAYSFTADNGSVLTVEPVSLGGFKEKEGFLKKFRRHESVEGIDSSVETLSVIPFGIEPEIGRNMEFAANHAKVITDIQLKAGMNVSNISLDNVTVTGSIMRVGIIPVVDNLMELPPIEWNKMSADMSELYCADEPFLVCLVEMTDGQVWEIGTGDDIWRWNCGSRYHAGAEFKITASSSSVNIQREVYIKREESEMPQRGLRFKWYFAWSVTDNAPAMPEVDGFNGFDLLKLDLPNEGKVMYAEDKLLDAPCFESNSLRKRFRTQLRSIAGDPDLPEEIAIINAGPHLCLSASHLDRGKKHLLRHWDILNVMDQWLWANRQLHKVESLVRFYAVGEVVSGLPSVYGLKNVFPPEEADWTR